MSRHSNMRLLLSAAVLALLVLPACGNILSRSTNSDYKTGVQLYLARLRVDILTKQLAEKCPKLLEPSHTLLRREILSHSGHRVTIEKAVYEHLLELRSRCDELLRPKETTTTPGWYKTLRITRSTPGTETTRTTLTPTTRSMTATTTKKRARTEKTTTFSSTTTTAEPTPAAKTTGSTSASKTTQSKRSTPTTGTTTEQRALPGEQQVSLMKLGTRVVRGPDWKWGNQDGNPPTVGTVTKELGDDSYIWVQWKSRDKNRYRMGAEGAYDLMLADSTSG